MRGERIGTKPWEERQILSHGNCIPLWTGLYANAIESCQSMDTDCCLHRGARKTCGLVD